MRIWSLHPKHLDTKGLVALWRETLLAKKVLEGKTKGYKNHPQLNRFKNTENPLHAINQYLSDVYFEAKKRNYNFNKDKIDRSYNKSQITVTDGQIKFEIEHLLKKLKIRDKEKYKEVFELKKVEVHPMFKIIEGEVEYWEII